jgi:hypothetical protein
MNNCGLQRRLRDEQLKAQNLNSLLACEEKGSLFSGNIVFGPLKNHTLKALK